MRNIKILDIFSYVPEKKLTLERIEKIFLGEIDGQEGDFPLRICKKEEIRFPIPDHIKDVITDLESENKKTGFLIHGEEIIAIIGYRNR